MWKHFCQCERAWLGVEDGRECNWCGKSAPSVKVVSSSDEAGETRDPLTEDLFASVRPEHERRYAVTDRRAPGHWRGRP